jgi:REP element-mobilizing transposase RayT
MPASYTNLLVQPVCSTKNRAPLIPDTVRKELHRHMSGIVRGDKSKVIEIDSVEDHIHILLSSDLVRAIKANSSHWLNERKPGKGQFVYYDPAERRRLGEGLFKRRQRDDLQRNLDQRWRRSAGNSLREAEPKVTL